MNLCLKKLSVGVCALLFAEAGFGYSRLYTQYPTPGESGSFGSGVSIIGDIDSDGYKEYAVGASSWNNSQGRVTVFSGKTGKAVYELLGTSQSSFGTSIEAIGDLDDDGVPDFLVGAAGVRNCTAHTGTVGYVRAVSGADGSAIYEVSGSYSGGGFGAVIRSLGDLDADGKLDFLVTEPGAVPSGGVICNTSNGRVYVYLGRSGTLRFSRTGTIVNGVGSIPGAGAVGDVDKDGVPDFAAAIATQHGNAIYHDTYIYSGKDNSFIMQVDGGGSDVLPLGDIDNDSYVDFVVVGGSYVWTGVKAISGRTGQIVYSISDSTGSIGAMRGRLAGDRNLDGHGDFAYAGWVGSSYLARVVSGVNGSILTTYRVPIAAEGYVNSLAADSDVNGDGMYDILMGYPAAVNGRGVLYLSFNPLLESTAWEPVRMLLESAP